MLCIIYRRSMTASKRIIAYTTRSIVINDVHARAIISIFPRRHDDRVVVTRDPRVGALIIIIIKRYRRRRRGVSTLSSPDTFHDVCARSVATVYNTPVVRGARLGSRVILCCPRGRADRVFGTAPSRWQSPPARRPVTRTSARSICVNRYILILSYHYFYINTSTCSSAARRFPIPWSAICGSMLGGPRLCTNYLSI